ncbi:MAG TPA: glycosyltransferase [Miltoncostaea sp.]|nr:glycosyltransferase [Miltoncostaea sp.]
MPPSPDMTVVVCSKDGAATIDRTLASLARQTFADRLEVVVVDDGSADATAAVAARRGATVVRNDRNLGLAASRNRGVAASSAPVVAFIDDDCEADPRWAERLLAAYADGVTGVGGTVEPGPGDDFTRSYLRRHNPLEPLEMELARSERPLYRLRLYLSRQWASVVRPPHRDVFSLVGASMSFRRGALERAGGFDEAFAFGAEELELCYRMRRHDPSLRLVLAEDARVVHHFRPSLRDTLRRSRSYGRGTARLHRRWRSVRPTVFPVPVIVAGAALAAARRPALAAVAAAAPALLYPSGVAAAVRARRPRLVADAYVQLAQETLGNAGAAEGLWRFRDLPPAVGA